MVVLLVHSLVQYICTAVCLGIREPYLLISEPYLLISEPGIRWKRWPLTSTAFFCASQLDREAYKAHGSEGMKKTFLLELLLVEEEL